jgi:hypothetical protein
VAGNPYVSTTPSPGSEKRKKLALTFDFKGLASCLGAALDTDEDSAGSALGTLLKSSFPDGFGFGGSSLTSSLTSFGSDLTTGLESLGKEAAFERPGSLFLEVDAAADFKSDKDRVCWTFVRFCGKNTVYD